MKTERTEITRKIYVFAEAKSDYQLDNLDPGELPFDYKLKSYDYGDETSVRIMEHPVTLIIPEGIDITLECVKNLQEQIDKVQREAAAEVKKLEQRIRNLTLLEYKPVNEEDSDGEMAAGQ